MEQIRLRRKYVEKNGGIDNVFNDIKKKDEYVEFLTELLGIENGITTHISWTQKRSRN